MKKTITPVLINWAFYRSLTKTSFLLQASLLLFAGLAATSTLHAQCSMACAGSTNVSLSPTCEGTITYDMILQNPNNCSPNGPSAYQVIVMDLAGFPIPTSPVVNADHIGQTLTVKVKHWASGNSCWGNINVEDKVGPTITCPANVTVPCTHFEALRKMEAELQALRQANGEPYKLVALPMADAVYFEGERLPATYANFLVINGAVLVPFYQSEKDAVAKRIFEGLFPDREIISINCLPLIKQHGSLHCVTMQFPEGTV